MSVEQIRARVSAWLEQVVIGLKLCPFAAAPWKAGEVKIAISEVTDPEMAVRAALDEALELIHPALPDDESEDANHTRIRTILVCFPNALDDFDTFLDVAETLEQILSQAGADGVLQVATFHPAYQFEGEPEGALSHFTNRSPVPVLHLLLEADVTDAVDSHPDPERIPEENIKRLEAMGADEIKQLWAPFAG